MSVEDEDTSLCYSVSCKTAGVGRRWREQRYKPRKEIYKKLYTEKWEKKKG
jgi:hypothetical protein